MLALPGLAHERVLDLAQRHQQGLGVLVHPLAADGGVRLDLGAAATAVEDRRRELRRDAREAVQEEDLEARAADAAPPRRARRSG